MKKNQQNAKTESNHLSFLPGKGKKEKEIIKSFPLISKTQNNKFNSIYKNQETSLIENQHTREDPRQTLPPLPGQESGLCKPGGAKDKSVTFGEINFIARDIAVSTAKKTCQCCDGEEVWLPREDFDHQPSDHHTSDHHANHDPHANHDHHASDHELAVFDSNGFTKKHNGQEEEAKLRLRRLTNRAPTPFRSSSLPDTETNSDVVHTDRIRHTLESRRLDRLDGVVKETKLMIAEWWTIAKVVDRVLFLLSLILTIFAYIFILVVIPSEISTAATTAPAHRQDVSRYITLG